MRRCRLLVVAVSLAAVWATGPLAVAGAAAAGAVRVSASSWGPAIEVPGLGALNKRGTAVVVSVSCASAKSCVAGGFYLDRRRHRQGFVGGERGGRWSRATEVPGLGALNTGGDAVVESVSCGSAASCVAGGFYRDRHHHSRGFVAVERDGRWRAAVEVPGLAALDAGGFAEVTSVSCGSAGNCAAGGDFQDRHGHRQGFVAGERDGRWSRATEVPGLSALNTGGDAAVVSVSCGSAGSCVAGGDYTRRNASQQGFVADEDNGEWGTAIEVPGLAALNASGHAEVTSVSCGSAGNCAAGGDYQDRHGHRQGFVADDRNGRWRAAVGVPGLATLDAGGHAEVNSVSCGSAGSCVAGGDYTRRNASQQGFVADQDRGVWGTAIELPGLAALNTGGFVQVLSVSCGSPGSCVAGGDYTRRNLSLQGFVADQDRGVWGTAIELPGLAALNTGGGAVVTSVSCSSAGSCAAGGEYTDRHHRGQGFVAAKLHGWRLGGQS